MDYMMDPTHGKLVAKWEGPYIVTRGTGTRAYYLQDQDGRDIPNPYNVSNLSKYFH